MGFPAWFYPDLQQPEPGAVGKGPWNVFIPISLECAHSHFPIPISPFPFPPFPFPLCNSRSPFPFPCSQVRARCQPLPVKEETLQRVGLYIDTIIGSLPEDLQAVLHHP